jgi:AcrR family transcriptional regulator
MGRPDLKTRRAQYHHGDLAQALKTIALDMIAEHGVAAFSMRDAAQRLGVAHSAVYRHFADKSDLFTAISRDGFHQLGRLWHHLMAQSESQVPTNPALIALARFSAGADAYFQFAGANPALFQLMYGPFGTGTFGLAGLAEIDENNPYRILSGVLDGLLHAGLITAAARPNAEVKAYAAIHGIACLLVSGVFKGADAATITAQFEQVKNLVFGGLVIGPQEQWLTNPAFAHLPPEAIGCP